MNEAQREAAGNRLHIAVTLLALWLVTTSPWVSMLRRVPASAGFFDYAHLILGVLALFVGILYGLVVVHGGRWKLYFPLAAGNGPAVGRDLAGLVRGKVPAAEGGRLFGAIEGLLLVALVAAGVSGVVWLLLQGADAALTWRMLHIVFARVLIAAGVLHVLAVASHLLDFVRD
ncbi:MAG: cytochrome b/b6 domain-containing protein [Proteobacteria bacterium]|nr:cytochrome b/b6 domain-containing protein [Pseudomonadota bacterium]